MDDVLKRFTDWLKRPYASDMSALGWFAFFGLLIVISWLWSTTLRKVTSELA